MIASNNLRSDNQPGAIVLAMLILTACLTSAVITAELLARDLIQIQQDNIHASLARRLALEESLAISAKVQHAPKQQLHCNDSKQEVGRFSIVRSTCLLHSITSAPDSPITSGNIFQNSLDFPLLDYNQIFTNATTCRSILHNGSRKSAFGHALTTSASLAPHTCVNPFQLLVNNLATTSNLAIEMPLVVGTSNNIQPIMLAAAGYLDIDTTLQINQPMLLVAGGDMYLREVVASSPLDLTLVSATGAIVVNKIDGPAAIAAHAWQNVFIPSKITIGNTLRLPPVVNELLYIATSQ